MASNAGRGQPCAPSHPCLCFLRLQDIFNLLPNLNVTELNQSFAVRCTARGSA